MVSIKYQLHPDAAGRLECLPDDLLDGNLELSCDTNFRYIEEVIRHDDGSITFDAVFEPDYISHNSYIIEEPERSEHFGQVRTETRRYVEIELYYAPEFTSHGLPCERLTSKTDIAEKLL